MSLKQEDRVRPRAYQLWLDAGLPDRGSVEFWQVAEDQEADEEVKTWSRTGESFPADDPQAHRKTEALVGLV